jgi:hypothetical protein
MPVSYSDPRKLRFLGQIPEKYRSDVTNIFLRGIRAKITSPAEICAAAWRWVGARGAELAGMGWTPGPGTIPAEQLQEVIEGDGEAAEAFAAYLTEWETLPPAEKDRLKAAHKQGYRDAYVAARGAR